MGEGEGSKALPEGFFEQLVLSAHARGATHVHLEPDGQAIQVRYRIDGTLRPGKALPLALYEPLLRQIKQRADTLDDPRLPQTGLFFPETSSGRLQCQVELIPGVLGEKVCVWIQEPTRRVELPLAELGMSREQLEHLRAALRQRRGLIAFTGWTWCGKNTTAYSSLLELEPEGRSMASIEVAVRGILSGVHQVVVDERIGFSMASALRALVSSDHEVIYLRELMDFETAELCVRAVISQGRLVLTTLHTNDAASVVSRLENMGIERWLVAGSLLLVQAQRRLRRLCPHCRREVKASPGLIASAGFPPQLQPPETLHVPVGCERCDGTGYAGRILVCETLPFTPTLQELILAGASHPELKQAAVREGMKTLRVSGLERVREGLTSLDEVLLYTPKDAS